MTKNYSDEFKLSVIKEYYESNLGVRKIAAKYNLSSKNLVLNWEKQLKEKGLLPTEAKKDPDKIKIRSDKIDFPEKTQREIEYEKEIEHLYAKIEYYEQLEHLQPFISKKTKVRELKYRAIFALEFKYTVKFLCEIAGVKRKAYCNFRDKPIKKEDPIEKIIIQIYNKSKGVFGYRRIGNELRNAFKIVVNHKKIQRIMQENNLRSRIRRKKNRIQDDKQFKANILNRDFKASRPGEKIATDITCIPYRNSKLYLCVALDLFNNEPVSWEYSKNPDSKLTVKTIEKLSKKIDIKNTVIHSDQGVQYTSKEYSSYLKSLGAV